MIDNVTTVSDEHILAMDEECFDLLVAGLGVAVVLEINGRRPGGLGRRRDHLGQVAGTLQWGLDHNWRRFDREDVAACTFVFHQFTLLDLEEVQPWVDAGI